MEEEVSELLLVLVCQKVSGFQSRAEAELNGAATILRNDDGRRYAATLGPPRSTYDESPVKTKLKLKSNRSKLRGNSDRMHDPRPGFP